MPVSVHLLPALIAPGSLRGGVAVVIDVLRASTTICAALAAGAAGLFPVASPRAARTLAARRRKLNPREALLLGGERGGVRIPGFDLDNSPASYSPAAVSGRTIIFTTTNGTAAAIASRRARAGRIVFGCFGNLSAVESFVRACGMPVHLVCAGSGGRVSLEDTVFAGVLAARLLGPGGGGGGGGGGHAAAAGDDCTALALLAAHSLGINDKARAMAAITRAAHAGTLAALGFGHDLRRCAAVDSCKIVPEFDLASAMISMAKPVARASAAPARRARLAVPKTSAKKALKWK